jgi:dGTPase
LLKGIPLLYTASDFNRESGLLTSSKDFKLRPPFWRDYARLIHSPAFRRLQGKTQLFPGTESDFFRNRLTHSLEVAQVAKSIAIRINGSDLTGKTKKQKIDLDLITFAGLTHDLGHPPFGHNGEMALDECMKDHGGFEGNAQTLRILARLEKKGEYVPPFSGKGLKDSRRGLDLTHRSLASILKYDQKIPIKSTNRPKSGICKGYYSSEAGLVRNVKKNVIGDSKYNGKFKTIECQIMDLADDIAYSTYDLEDALKAGFLSPIEILADTLNDGLMDRVAAKVSNRTGKSFDSDDVVYSLLNLFFETGLFNGNAIVNDLKAALNDRDIYILTAKKAVQAYAASNLVASNGYYRTELTSGLVDTFIKGVEVKWNSKFPIFSTVSFNDDVFTLVESLKNYTFVKFIESSRLKVAEYRGYRIVKELFEILDSTDGINLLPSDFKEWFDAAPTESDQKRVICDFIAGMTDKYIIEFYGRLKSENPQTMFKPI